MTSKRNNLKNVMGVLLAFAAGTTVALAQDTTQPAAPAAPQTTPETAPAAAPSTDWAPAQPATADDSANMDTTQPDANEDSNVVIDDNMTVDLHVKDEDLANVLEMLSIQSQKNIIASKDVQARVTANLYGVTFYEALDAILNVNG